MREYPRKASCVDLTTVIESTPREVSFNGSEIDQLTAGHMLSEFFTPTEGRGRRVDEWKLRPSRLDNDGWDCLVGCAVAASQEGITMGQHAQDTRARAHRKRVRLPGRR